MQSDGPLLTPRTLEATEERLNEYLAVHREAEEASGVDAKAGEGNGLDADALREMWDSTIAPVPLSPSPTAVPQDLLLSPLNEVQAIDVLRKASPCIQAELNEYHLGKLLRAGSRRLLPRYAAAMTEGLQGNSVYIVLRGKLHAGSTRIDRQSFLNRLPVGQRDRTPLPTGLGEDILGPADTFGILSALVPVPRERDVVTLEPTELLVFSFEKLDRLNKMERLLSNKYGDFFKSGIVATFVESSLCKVNFFSTLPPLTIRQIARLFSVRYHDKSNMLFEQGEPGHEMFILLWGKVQVWRLKKRDAPRVMLAEYTGTSTYPWLGETFQWQSNVARAGDGNVIQPTLSLTLRVPELPQFAMLCPGFKALTMSVASGFIVQKLDKVKTLDDENEVIEFQFAKKRERTTYEKPMKYALEWVRIVGILLGYDGLVGWNAASAAKSHQLSLEKLNSLDWAHDLEAQEAKLEAVVDDEQPFLYKPLTQTQLLLAASRSKFGDSRTILNAAAKKEWRGSWGPEKQIRAEVLRLMGEQPGGIKQCVADSWSPSPEIYSQRKKASVL